MDRRNGQRGGVSRRRFLQLTGAAGVMAACGAPAARPSRGADKDDLAFASLERVSQLLARRQISPVELVEAALTRVGKLNPTLDSFITVTADRALDAARAAEQLIARGHRRSAIDGIPMAHKDLFDTSGVRTTMGSEIYAGRVPDHDAAVVAQIKAAGGVSLGKLNMWEFAAAFAGVNRTWGSAANPWNTARLTGGSSTGSGAATAAGLVYAATGSDTGGSSRMPASYCGVVGLKGTYGLVSTEGMFPNSPTFDHVGYLARNVRDVAILFWVLAGSDPRSPATYDPSLSGFLAGIEKGAAGLRVGVPPRTSWFWSGMNSDIDTVVQRAISTLESAGASIREVDLPRPRSYFDWWQILTGIELRKVHSPTYPRLASKYSPDIVAIFQAIDPAAMDQALAAYRPLVLGVRNSREADQALSQVDVLAVPTMRQPVLTISQGDELLANHVLAELLANFHAENVAPFNVTGQPAISVPCGFTTDRMPVGLMLAAPRHQEMMLLRAARAYEQARGPFPHPLLPSS